MTESEHNETTPHEESFENGGREVSLRDFAAVLFRRKWIVLGVFCAAVVAVVLLNMRSPVVYESTARVRVSRGEPESAFSSRLRVLSWEEDLNSEIETVTSGQIVESAEARLAEDGETRPSGEEIQVNRGDLRAETAGKSSVVYITYRDTDPQVARVTTKAITQSYSDFSLRLRAVPEVEQFFREEIESLRGELDEWEQRRASFMNEESIIRIADERINLLGIRQQAEVDLNRLRANLAEEEAKIEVLRGRLLLEGEDAVNLYPFGEGDNRDDQVVARLRTEIVRERTEMYELAAQYTEDHPSVLAARDRVGMLEEAARQEMQNYIRHIESRVEVMHAREEAILRTLQFVDSQLASFPDKEARLASYDRVLDQLRANWNAIVQKQNQARIEQTGTPDLNVLVLDPAGPARAVRTNDYVRMALIPALSLLLGVALAFLIDGMDHSIKDAAEVETYLRLPVLGSVGRIR